MPDFTHFTDHQKELFFSIIDELPSKLYDCKEKDLNYLEMKISHNEQLNSNNISFIRNSALLLRILKEVLLWNQYLVQQGIDPESDFQRKKAELLDYIDSYLKKHNIEK